MRTSEHGVAFVKAHEAFRDTAYVCPAGKLTIGYGHTDGVRPGQTITEEDADALLRAELVHYELAVEHHVTEPLNQNEYDALVSLCYNIGPTNFGKSSVVRFINEGHKRRAAEAFLLWDKARVNGKLVPLAGLTARRKRERELFLTPIEETDEPI